MEFVLNFYNSDTGQHQMYFVILLAKNLMSNKRYVGEHILVKKMPSVIHSCFWVRILAHSRSWSEMLG